MPLKLSVSLYSPPLPSQLQTSRSFSRAKSASYATHNVIIRNMKLSSEKDKWELVLQKTHVTSRHGPTPSSDRHLRDPRSPRLENTLPPWSYLGLYPHTTPARNGTPSSQSAMPQGCLSRLSWGIAACCGPIFRKG